MKVAHTIHGLGLGGAQKVVASIVRGRLSADLRYFVYCCQDGFNRREVEEAGATVRILPRALPKFDPLWMMRLARAMRRDRVDLVHAHLFGDSLHSYLATRLIGAPPVILTLHIGPEGWNRLQRRAYPWLLSRCARAVACSMSVQRALRVAHPEATRMMEAIPNGIELPVSREPDDDERADLKRSLGVDPDAVLITAIGRLTEQKGLPYLLSAFAQLCRAKPDARARLVLLGEGELRHELERQAVEEGVGESVVFAGIRQDVRELLPVFDVVVFSSLYEGLPIALLEAMAAGRCLVCTDIPATLDAVRDEREALLVPVANVDRLAEALGRVVDEPALRRSLGAGARRHFAENFTAKDMVERYEDLYRRVLAARQPGSPQVSHT